MHNILYCLLFTALLCLSCDDSPLDRKPRADADTDTALLTDDPVSPDADAPVDPAIVWLRVWGTERDDRGDALGLAGELEGDLYVAGTVGVPPNGAAGSGGECTDGGTAIPCSEQFLMKWTVNGDPGWTRLWGAEGMDTFGALAVDPDASSYLFGTGGRIMFDKEGGERWRKDAPTGERTIAAYAPTVAMSYVVKELETTDPVSGEIVRTYNVFRLWATGSVNWEREVAHPSLGVVPTAVAASAYENVVVVGSVPNGSDVVGHEVTDLFVARYGLDGALVWSEYFGDPEREVPRAMLLDDMSGYLYVLAEVEIPTGDPAPSYQTDLMLFKISTDGQLVWRQRWGTPDHDRAGGMAFGAWGVIHIAATTAVTIDERGVPAEYDEISVVTFRSDGRPLPEYRIDRTVFDGTVCSIAASPSGELFLAGTTLRHSVAGMTDIFLMRFDESLVQPDDVQPDDAPSDQDAELPDIDTVGVVPGEMVDVPAGPFMMGCNEAVDTECVENEKPYHQVTLSAYKIGKYEVTVAEYQACMDDGACNNDDPNVPQFTTYAGKQDCNLLKPGMGSYPAGCIGWYGAVAYCLWKGQRLPTEAEWEKAARGTDGRKYPWGNDSLDCEHAIIYDAASYSGGCGKDGTWPIGSRPAGASPYGAHDMIGNSSEWVHDSFDEGYYAVSPADDPQGPVVIIGNGDMRVIRGGTAFGSSFFLRTSMRDYDTYVSAHYTMDPGKGFRCAE